VFEVTSVPGGDWKSQPASSAPEEAEPLTVIAFASVTPDAAYSEPLPETVAAPVPSARFDAAVSVPAATATPPVKPLLPPSRRPPAPALTTAAVVVAWPRSDAIVAATPASAVSVLVPAANAIAPPVRV